MPLELELSDAALAEVSPVAQSEHARLLRSAVQRTQLLRLAMKGLTAKQAAEIVGCDPQTARVHYRDPEFRKVCLQKVEAAFSGIDADYVENKKTLHQLIETQAYESFSELLELLKEDIHPSLKVKIHQDFLNRCEESKPLSGVEHGHRFTAEELQRAAAVAREIDRKVIPIKREKVG